MPETTRVTMHIPSPLSEILQAAADKAGHTIQAQILLRLAKAAKVEIEPPKRGRRWPAKDAS